MKKQIVLLVAMTAYLIPMMAQGPHHGNGPGNGHPNNSNWGSHPNNQLRYATMDNGKRIVLFPDGTWEFAPNQPLPPPPPPTYTSEFWGNDLIINLNGKEVDRVKVSYSTSYDKESKKIIGDVAFGTAAYTFNGKEGDVRFLGQELVGKAQRFEDARSMAAYHYTTEIYNGLTSNWWGSYLIVSEHGKEIDRIRTSYHTSYNSYTKCLEGGVTIGTANYQFNECDGQVRFLGTKPIGEANKFEGARSVAAFHYVQSHYAPLTCGG